jgi:ribosomal protein S18 acetylase RimI-like enzyme
MTPDNATTGAAMHDLTDADIPEVVELIKEIGLGYMSGMPDAFISLYYKNIAHCPDWRCRVLKRGDRLLGFHILTIGKFAPRHAPFFKTPLRFLAIAAARVLPVFTVLRYCLMEVTIKGEQRRSRETYDSELVYIGIRKGEQGKGFGGILMRDMRRILEDAGVAYLGTEYYKDDPQADRFYKKYNYEKLREINTGGRMSISIRYPVERLPA